eukprot:Amastigsp_a509246_120.p2 type:complete len:343 gc:universal Amastigsp_a509246_120:1119-91(-)
MGVQGVTSGRFVVQTSVRHAQRRALGQGVVVADRPQRGASVGNAGTVHADITSFRGGEQEGTCAERHGHWDGDRATTVFSRSATDDAAVDFRAVNGQTNGGNTEVPVDERCTGFLVATSGASNTAFRLGIPEGNASLQWAVAIVQASSDCTALAGVARGAFRTLPVRAVVQLALEASEVRRGVTDDVLRTAGVGNGASCAAAIDKTEDGAAGSLQSSCASTVLVRAQAVVGVHLAELDHAQAAAQADEGVTAAQWAGSRSCTVVVSAETRVDLENSFQAATEVFSAADDETRRTVSNGQAGAVGASSAVGIFRLRHTGLDVAGQGHRRLSESANSRECSQSN